MQKSEVLVEKKILCSYKNLLNALWKHDYKSEKTLEK